MYFPSTFWSVLFVLLIIYSNRFYSPLLVITVSSPLSSVWSPSPQACYRNFTFPPVMALIRLVLKCGTLSPSLILMYTKHVFAFTASQGAAWTRVSQKHCSLISANLKSNECNCLITCCPVCQLFLFFFFYMSWYEPLPSFRNAP